MTRTSGHSMRKRINWQQIWMSGALMLNIGKKKGPWVLTPDMHREVLRGRLLAGTPAFTESIEGKMQNWRNCFLPNYTTIHHTIGCNALQGIPMVSCSFSKPIEGSLLVIGNYDGIFQSHHFRRRKILGGRGVDWHNGGSMRTAMKIYI